MDRCALFVDAGYMLADGAMAVHGTRNRESVSWDYAGVIQFLGNMARDRTGLPLLRCYWYEATVEGRRTSEHDALADLPGVKLRLGRMRPGRREGVESEIHRDLATLARNHAVSDALVVSAEEDLSQVIADVQDLGMRVTIVHITVDGNWTISRTLRQECDGILEIGEAHLRPYVELTAGAEAIRDDDRQVVGAYTGRGGGNGHGAIGALSHQAALPVGSHPAPPAIYTAPVIAEYQRVAQPLNGQPALPASGAAGGNGGGLSHQAPAAQAGQQFGGQQPAAPRLPSSAPSSGPEVNGQPGPQQGGIGQGQQGLGQQGMGQSQQGMSQQGMGQQGLGQSQQGMGPQGMSQSQQGMGPQGMGQQSAHTPMGMSPQSVIQHGQPGHQVQASPPLQPLPPGMGSQGGPQSSAAAGQAAQQGMPQPGHPQPGHPQPGQPGPPGPMGPPGMNQPPSMSGMPQQGQTPGPMAGQSGMHTLGGPGMQPPSPGMQMPGVQSQAPHVSQPMYPSPTAAQGGFRPSQDGPGGQGPGGSRQGAGNTELSMGGPTSAGHLGQPGPGGPQVQAPPRPYQGGPAGRFAPGPHDPRAEQFGGHGGQQGGAPGTPYVPPQGPYSGPQPAAQHSPVPPPMAVSLADAVQAAHGEGFQFGQAVARDAPALWLEAVLARKPRMPSDLEARLLQDSALPIDSLLHDEVRHALRRGFWDALERARH